MANGQREVEFLQRTGDRNHPGAVGFGLALGEVLEGSGSVGFGVFVHVNNYTMYFYFVK